MNDHKLSHPNPALNPAPNCRCWHCQCPHLFVNDHKVHTLSVWFCRSLAPPAMLSSTVAATTRERRRRATPTPSSTRSAWRTGTRCTHASTSPGERGLAPDQQGPTRTAVPDNTHCRPFWSVFHLSLTVLAKVSVLFRASLTDPTTTS